MRMRGGENNKLYNRKYRPFTELEEEMKIISVFGGNINDKLNSETEETQTQRRD